MYEYTFTKVDVIYGQEELNTMLELLPKLPPTHMGQGWEFVSAAMSSRGSIVYWWKRPISVQSSSKRFRLVIASTISAGGIALMIISNFIDSSILDRLSVTTVGGFILGWGFCMITNILSE